MEDFRDLKQGDHAFTIVRMRGQQPYAVMERMNGPGGGEYLRTLPCYADGTPMIYFGTLWRARSGIEVKLPQHGDRPRRRLVRHLPAGIECVAPPASRLGGSA